MATIVLRGVEVEAELRDADPCRCGDCPLCENQDAEALGIEAELQALVAQPVPDGYSVDYALACGARPWCAWRLRTDTAWAQEHHVPEWSYLGRGTTREAAAALCRADHAAQDDPDSAPCGTCHGDGRDPGEVLHTCPECGGIGEVYDPGWRDRVAAEWAKDLRSWREAIDHDITFQAVTEVPVESLPYTAEDAAEDTWYGLGYAMVAAVVPERWADAYAAGRRAAEAEEIARIVAWDEAVGAGR